MINFGVNDYVVIETPKKQLVRVIEQDSFEVRGLLESSLVSGDNTVVQFKADQVLTNLGPKPKIGTVHGVKVEPWIKTFDTAIGDCDVYFRPAEPKVFKAMVEKESEKMLKSLKKWGLDDLAPVQLELRIAKGKKAQGMYMYGSGRGELDIIVCRPQDAYTMHFLLAHEFGHAIWAHNLSTKVKAKWVEKYHSAVDVYQFDGAVCRRLLDDMLAFEGMIPSQYAGQLEEEEAEQYQNILHWIEGNHGLRPKDLDVLHAIGNEELIHHVWPSHVSVSDMRVLVSEYGKRNVEELWCDSLAYHVTGHTLPEDIEVMVEKTLKAAAR